MRAHRMGEWCRLCATPQHCHSAFVTRQAEPPRTAEHETGVRAEGLGQLGLPGVPSVSSRQRSHCSFSPWALVKGSPRCNICGRTCLQSRCIRPICPDRESACEPCSTSADKQCPFRHSHSFRWFGGGAWPMGTAYLRAQRPRLVPSHDVPVRVAHAFQDVSPKSTSLVWTVPALRPGAVW
jgi:hypothetical protein